MGSGDTCVYLRLGSHAEKDYFEKTLKLFDGIAIGANLVESTPGATASLLVKFSGKRQGLPYFIDPMTYAYGEYVQEGSVRRDLDWIKSDQKRKNETVRDFKRSYRGLGDSLGTVFESAVKSGSAINTRTFKSADVVRACCEKVVEYQICRVRGEFEKDPELRQFAEKVPLPAVVFAPYFYIEPSDLEGWLDVNLTLARVSAEIQREIPVHAIICIDESFLGDVSFCDRIKEELPKTGVKGVWFWFSRFYEDRTSNVKLRALRSLTEVLSQKIEVYNKHGGFFSLALSHFGMKGICHGVGYGEQKDVLPVIGQSTPTVRYYLSDVHKRFGVPQIERCFQSLGVESPEQFYEQICNCVICRGVVHDHVSQFSEFGDMHFSTPKSKRMAQTPAAAKRCRFHFLLSRIKERDAIRKESIDEVLNQLSAANEKWGRQASLKSELSYLPQWHMALS